LGTGFSAPGTVYRINKGNSAVIKNILEGTAANTSSSKLVNDGVCDLQIAIGNTTYLLSTTSGTFIISENGSSFILDTSWLMSLLPRLK
jgi:hypothetical protein